MTGKLLGVLPLLLLHAGASSAGVQDSPWTVVRSAEREWTVTYVAASPAWRTVQLEGVAHRVFAPPYHPGSCAEGVPGLPVDALSFGIPPGSTLSATLETADYAVEEGCDVAPVPTLETREGSSPVYVYRKDRSAYGRGEGIPAEMLQVDEPFELRGQRVATVRLAPVQYSPIVRTLRTLRRARIVVRATGGASAIDGGASDPLCEPLFRSLLANADEARQWRVNAAARRKVAVDSTRAWFVAGVPYAKIDVVRDGWYGITRSALVPVLGPGVSLEGLRLVCRGTPVPVHLRGDSLMEFYGYRQRGDSAFVNDVTDTNAYWLTSGLSMPFREVALSGQAADTVSASLETEHFEENRAMYVGTTEQEVISNAPIPGRGWVWEFLYPGTTIVKTFALDTLDVAGPASIAVRFFSTTLHYSTPDHRARLWVNDSLVGEIAFDARSPGIFRAGIPGNILRAGTNVLRITSVATASFPNQFYLDWFEIQRSRPLVASGGILRFHTGPSGVPLRAFEASGFSSADVGVFDLTNGRKLGSGSVSPDGRGGYRTVFTDTVTSARVYLLAPSGASGEPVGLRRRVFADHRSNARGADYIVITHRLVAAAAADLAAHRERTNAVRSAVVDVEDVYDEFNYGVKSPGAIKDFLRFAAASWPQPHPSSVLFFGDACVDPKWYDTTTTKADLVPSYGHPTGDNWFACFDETRPFLPSLFVGRLPVEHPSHAAAVVAKAKVYDAYEPAAWNKRFLFISGGNSDAEQVDFEQMNSRIASLYVSPAPVGGEVQRIGKKTSIVIDGDSRQSIKELVRQGLVHMNFLGHSGGRVWNVDVGDPAEFENTGGQLPFVTSVSCNVGSFASAFQNCLGEDFLFPDGRGAIAVWGSSSLGYAFFGSTLVEYFLQQVSRDTLRELGALTTAARIRLWQVYGTSPVSVAHINLTPLLGDPLTRLALPIRPDLAVRPDDVIPDRSAATAADTALRFRAAVHNYGLVPVDSFDVEATDAYGTGQPEVLLRRRLSPVFRSDTVDFRLQTFARPGKHTLRIQLDPAGKITEVGTTNNTVSLETYVHSMSTRALRPFNDAVVTPGTVRLVVTVPGGGGQRTAFFELDTLPSFDSPRKVTSGPVVPEDLSARWTTPALAAGGTWFWRARIDGGPAEGLWAFSAFSTSAEVVPAPYMRWRQSSPGQFTRNLRAQTVPTDSGVALGAPAPIRLYARSLGARSTTNGDQFSALRINDVTTLGYWWALGTGILTARVAPLTGLYELRSFDMAYRGEADSLAAFVDATPAGDYLVFAVILDGASRATERFYASLESLGSTRIRQLKNGDSWTFIARKGGGILPGLPAEHLSATGMALDSVEVPARFGEGTMEALPLPRAAAWSSFGWESSGAGARLAFSGLRPGGTNDSIFVTSSSSGEFDLRTLDPRLLAENYRALRPLAALTTTDPLRSPLVKRWWVDLLPAADLAVGSVRLAIADTPGMEPALSARVQNLGASVSDSARCEVSVGDGGGTWSMMTSAAVPPLTTDSATSLDFRIPAALLPPRGILRVTLIPGPRAVDLFDENNTADIQVAKANPITGRIQVLADGSELLDGDFLAPAPALSIRVPGRDGTRSRTLRALVDGVVAGETTVTPESVSQGTTVSELVLAPRLARGTHEIAVWVVDTYAIGLPDTVFRTIRVRVADELTILNLYNYPNPFSSGTSFTFSLSGSRAPDGGKISVYTVAGRRVLRRELNDLRVGFNRVEWDGRDDDGDEIANGTYLYRLEVRAGQETQVAGGKLARVR